MVLTSMNIQAWMGKKYTFMKCMSKCTSLQEKAKVAVVRQQSEMLEQELLESLSATSKTTRGDFASNTLVR